jgi:low temperature requirement protein LtrA
MVRAMLPRLRRGSGDGRAAEQVTTLELFFDLVFVFTITQLTATLGHDHGWGGAGRAALLLALMWWMYGGYAWLTNTAPPVTARRRGFLLLGMAGNFVMALAIPHAYTTDRVVFAGGYFVVVLVYAVMFITESARVTAGMVLQLLVWNTIAALLVVCGALLAGTALVVLWVSAVLVDTVVPRLAALTPLRRLDPGEDPGFTLVPGHFVERHGLMLLIVLGESVLAIGVGVSSGRAHIGPAQVAYAVISLALAASLYWAYFGTGEDQAAERALEATAENRRQSVALNSYGYALVVMLLAVVFAASGLHQALPDPLRRIDVEWAAHLSVGVVGFWVGLALFRASIGRRDIGLASSAGWPCRPPSGSAPTVPASPSWWRCSSAAC